MALPLDNPSYFAVPKQTLFSLNLNQLKPFKKKMGATSSHEFISEIQPLKGTGTIYKGSDIVSPNGRMPLRTLLRSVSSNSADSNQELLVLGEPRPSDIAPRSPSSDTSKKSRKSNKSKSGFMTIDSPFDVANPEYSEEVEEEEVFLTDDSAKYYNLTAPKDTGRRHSIGTYLQERERSLSIASSSKSFREELPQATVHATIDGEIVKPASITLQVEQSRRTGSSRKRCNRCTAKGSGCTSSCPTGMDDIVIISSKESQAASLWVNYFGTCFNQISKQKNRPNLKVFQLGIEEINENTGVSANIEQRISGVKLNVIIVCPQLLEYVASQPKSSTAFYNLLKPDRTIAMLLGVTDENLTDVHHTALVSYKQWTRHQVGQDQDQDFARDFLSAAMGILTKVARQQHAAALEERTSFSVMPKKVKQSQNRLIVLLAEPLSREDIVRVSVDKNGDMIEVKSVKRRNPYTLKFTMPDPCLEVSSIVNIVVEKNGNILGTRPVKCESRLRELDQILRTINDPVEFMCQTLGFSPTNSEQLDSWMVHAFQRNLPPHFNLISSTPGASLRPGDNGNDMRQPSVRHPHGHEEYPTLLHFAARYGLEKLVWQLLECPGAETACELRNACDLTPAEIAESAGHTKLASALKGYMQMNEFTTMYSRLKELSQMKQPPPPDVDEDEYLLPRTVDHSQYSVPPPAKPYTPETSANSNSLNSGYLQMQPLNKQNTGTQLNDRTTPISSGRTTPITRANTLPKQSQADQISNHSFKSTNSQSDQTEINRNNHNNNNNSNINNNNNNNNIKQFGSYEDKVQRELLEILNDFKNNVFTLSEVEQLAENWRKRNDVQKSFKEKEEQLNVMRRQYERIQQEMKNDLKRSTPFDRIKSLFSRKNKRTPNTIIEVTNDNTLIVDDKQNNDHNGGPNALRPISSLSLQSTASSSSSGRMSTLSGCSATSFSDSGTHSDHEERKHLMRQASVDHEYFEISESKKSPNFNYMIPPAPKPLYKYPMKSNNNPQLILPISERPPHPIPRLESPTDDQYYIQFPPSGLPVKSPEAKKSSRSSSPSTIPEETQNEYLSIEEQQEACNDYINVPSATNYKPEEYSSATNEENLPEYMNFKPPNSITILPPRK